MNGFIWIERINPPRTRWGPTRVIEPKGNPVRLRQKSFARQRNGPAVNETIKWIELGYSIHVRHYVAGREPLVSRALEEKFKVALKIHCMGRHSQDDFRIAVLLSSDCRDMTDGTVQAHQIHRDAPLGETDGTILYIATVFVFGPHKSKRGIVPCLWFPGMILRQVFREHGWQYVTRFQ